MIWRCRANRNNCFFLGNKIKFSPAVLIFGSRLMVALIIAYKIVARQKFFRGPQVEKPCSTY